MTTLPTRAILIVIAAIVAGGMLYRAVDAWYLKPRAELIARIGSSNATLANHRVAKADNAGVSRDLQAYIDRTLGPNLEAVDHRLRTRLNRLAEQAKLQGVSVGTEGGGQAKLSPARTMFRSYRSLRDEIDFTEVQGWISGVGALADVVRLITAIEAEPWIKRIDQVRLDPRDNGARVNISLRLTTIFMPGKEPKAEQPVVPPSAELQSRFAALVSGNPFRVPPRPEQPNAEQPAVPAPAPTPPAPPPFPFSEWALTGVAQGPRGPEAWLLHRPSGESRVLMPGESLDAMTFAGASGENAQFTLGDQKVSVSVGAMLDQRTPVG